MIIERGESGSDMVESAMPLRIMESQGESQLAEMSASKENEKLTAQPNDGQNDVFGGPSAQDIRTQVTGSAQRRTVRADTGDGETGEESSGGWANGECESEAFTRSRPGSQVAMRVRWINHWGRLS